MAPPPEPEPDTSQTTTEAGSLKALLKSLVLSEEKGMPLRFKVLLPPNLERTAPVDKIRVKVEVEEADGTRYPPENLDRGRAYHLTFPHLTVGAIIESWCEGKLHGLLQLSRKQLSKLLRALRGEPVVAWVNQPATLLDWQGELLPGVHIHLETEPEPAEPEKPAPTPPNKDSCQAGGRNHTQLPHRPWSMDLQTSWPSSYPPEAPSITTSF